LVNYLVRRYIDQNSNERKQRKQYGYLAGFAGVFVNLFLAVIKVVSGLFSGSISLIGDGLNNLSDGGTNVVTLIGFKMSDKPPDKEHPFGHGRTEYVAAFIVSFVIMLLGYELFQSSLERIFNPKEIQTNLLVLGIIIFSMGVKVWLAYFYYKIGRKIDSQVLIAAGADSRNDVLATASVLISFLFARYTDWVVDGYIGVIVALFIFLNGVSFIRESINTLLGNRPDKDFVRKIKNYIKDFEEIESVHDIIVHDYGPLSKMVSAHVDISANYSLVLAHEIADRIERGIFEDYKISLVLHVDPILDGCHESADIKDDVETYLSGYAEVKGIHDFRILEQDKVVIFDLFITEDYDGDIMKVKRKVVEYLEMKHTYHFIIHVRKKNHYL